jgi:hypothetical protein
MRCNDFDAHIDEMLSGILHPDANQHMRQCERCTSHFRARAAVQSGLRKLASASAPGPSRATDRAVMDAYRRLQQDRAGREPQSVPRPAARLIAFPSRGPAPARASHNSHKWWSGAAAAAVALAVLGSGLHLRNVPTVSAPTVASAPAAPALQSGIAAGPVDHATILGKLSTRRSPLRQGQAGSQSGAGQVDAAAPVVASAALGSAAPRLAAAKAGAPRPAATYGERTGNGSAPVTQPAKASPLIHLASAGAASNVAQSASSTWPGYSNLMYCDPMVCSGPMQVVHIKVPVGQVKPNLGQSGGNGFVSADVVIGPDGVARAIRTAN